MVEWWSPDEGLGGGGVRKTSSGRAGSSGFSGAGPGMGQRRGTERTKGSKGTEEVKPVGRGPITLPRYPQPGARAGDVPEAPMGSLVAMLREGRSTGSPARGGAHLGSQQGGGQSTSPQQQSLAFTAPGSPGMKPLRQELRGPGAHPLVATNTDQLLGKFKGSPQIGVGVTPLPRRGVTLTFEDVVKRAKEIAEPSARPLPKQVPSAKPGQVPTFGQMMQELTGTPYGPTGERARQAYDARLKDPAYRFAGPDTFNPATWDVHKGRKQDELWTAYATAAFLPITDAALQKRSAEYSRREKAKLVSPPPLLSDNEVLKSKQLQEIRAVQPDFQDYSEQLVRDYTASQQEFGRFNASLNALPQDQMERLLARFQAKREQEIKEVLRKLSPDEVQREMYRRGFQLTRLQKEGLASAADYRVFKFLTDSQIINSMGADLVVNLLASEFGGAVASRMAARFPGLVSAGAKLATKLGAEEAAAVEAKTGALTTLKRGGQELVKRVRPGEHTVASGVAGGLQQPLTYALSDDHPNAGRLIQEAALGFGGGLVGERAFAGAVRGLGVPGRWVAQWAEKHPSVAKVRQVLGLIGSGDIQFREGAAEPEFSPKARQVLGSGEKPAAETVRSMPSPGAPAAPVLPGREVKAGSGSGGTSGGRFTGREQAVPGGAPATPGAPVSGVAAQPGGAAKAPGLHPLAAQPEPAPPPKGAHPDPRITTAPEQTPGAVAVSGEPGSTTPVLQGLVQIREAATARVAARQPRKGPAVLPRGRKGMRPGAVIGPGAVGDELGDLLDHALIGATHLAEGVLDRTAWDLRMVERAGEKIRPHLEVIRELARRIHQGWKENRIPTEGARVREAAGAYLQKLAANASATAEAAPVAVASRPPNPVGKDKALGSVASIAPNPQLLRNGKLLPEVESSRRAALERLRKGTGQWQYGLPDAATLRDYARVGATYLAKGFENRDAWKERMLADLGSEVEPHLDWIWQYTQRSYKSYFLPRWKKLASGGMEVRPSRTARPATLPEILGAPAKGNAPGGAVERPLGRPLSSDKKEVTNWKRQMKARNYPLEEIEAGIARYFDPVREQYADLAGKDNVFIPMPSTTGKNTVPEALARHLAKAFGGEVLSGDHIHPRHVEERKLLDVYERFIDPAEYELVTDLSYLAGKNVVIVDDILTSGDSTEGLRYALRQQGITRTDIVTLASSNKAATPDDLARLSRLVAKKAGQPQTVVKQLVDAQLKQAPRKLVDGLFRQARKADHAEAIYRRLSGKRTATPGNGG